MEDNIRIELEALISERNGMVAENMQRRHVGQSMAYCDNDFNALAGQMRKLLDPAAPDGDEWEKDLEEAVHMISDVLHSLLQRMPRKP